MSDLWLEGPPPSPLLPDTCLSYSQSSVKVRGRLRCPPRIPGTKASSMPEASSSVWEEGAEVGGRGWP